MSWYRTSAAAEPVRLRFTCMACKAPAFATVETQAVRTRGMLGGRWCDSEHTEYLVGGKYMRFPEIRCAACGCRAPGRSIKGQVSKRRCNASCTTSKSDKCVCECSGGRHGEAWSAHSEGA